MCRPYNGKMKEFKWRPGIFQEKLTELRMYGEICGFVHDDRFDRSLKRLILFAYLESVHIQPPCHWNYRLVSDELKIGLMNTECRCGIPIHCGFNNDKIHYINMANLGFNEEGQVMFTADHDVDFGFGGFFGIEMWTIGQEVKIKQLVQKMETSNQKEKRSVRARIIQFIDETMSAYERKILTYQWSAVRKGEVSEIITDSMLELNIRKLEALFHLKQQSQSSQTISKPKKVLTSRQKRLQADAIQAAKDAEEAKLKQLEKKKNDSVGANGRKKNGKTHFRKSQKPARL